MKRLLLAPLLIAGLQIPANALPWSGDIVEKTKVGEKIIVKQSAVDIEKNGWLFLKSRHEIILPKIEQKLAESDREIKSYRKYSSCSEPSYEYCLRRTSREGLTSIYDEIKQDAKNINDQLSLKFETPVQISKAEKLLDEVHWVTIDYTPIFVDLNNKKRPMKEQTAMCINPEITEEAKETWSRSTRWLWGTDVFDASFFRNTVLDQKVCDKYAKF